MQERKIEDNKIWEAYHRIMAGESLTVVANSEDISLDRGTLKRYIKTVVMPSLNPDEQEKFKNKMNKNFRGNSTERKREAKGKKKEKAIKGVNTENLQTLEIDAERFATLYSILAQNKHTVCARDTYIHKCVEHINFLTSIGFSTDEVFDFFIRRPRAFGADTTSIKEKYDYLLRKKGSKEAALEALKNNPGIISKKIDDVTGSQSHSEDSGRGEM